MSLEALFGLITHAVLKKGSLSPPLPGATGPTINEPATKRTNKSECVHRNIHMVGVFLVFGLHIFKGSRPGSLMYV